METIKILLDGQEKEIPQEVLNLAFEINALPKEYKDFMLFDLEKYKSACVTIGSGKNLKCKAISF